MARPGNPVGAMNEQSATRRLDLGGVRLTYLSDGAMELTRDGFFPDVAGAYWSERTLTPAGRVAAPIGAVLVERSGRLLLIDAGMGANQLDPSVGQVSGGALLDTLAQVGHAPEDIAAVAFTHLHVDHTGWGFVADGRGGWAKAFPNARYLVAEQEWGPYARGEIGLGAPPRAGFIEPLAAVRELFADGAEVFPGVRALVTPGHSPGHTSYIVHADRGQRVVVFGDVFHIPGQITHPEWPSAPDIDHAAVLTARQRILGELAVPDTIGFAFHFGDQAFGRLAREGGNGQYSWVPVPTEHLFDPPRGIGS